MLTLGSTKKSCVAQTIVVSTKKMFHMKVNVAQENYMSHKKICCGDKKELWHPKEDSCCLNMFSVAQKRITCLQKMVTVAYKYMLNWLKMFRVAQKIPWFNGTPNIHSVYRTSQPRCMYCVLKNCQIVTGKTPVLQVFKPSVVFLWILRNF